MHERHPRLGASGRAAASTTLKGTPNKTVPWHPPLAPRRVVPAPPAPTPRNAPAITLKQGFGLLDEENSATRIYARDSQDSLFPDAPAEVEEIPVAHQPGAAAEVADEDATRSWSHAEARHAAGLWGDSSQEPSATANVTQDELEELREQLQLAQDRKVSSAPAAPPPVLKTYPEAPAQEPMAPQSRPRRRTNVKWLTSFAVLTFIGLGVVAHQTGYLSRFDVSRFDVSQVDARPLLSGVGKAQASLRTEYDKLFSVQRASRPAPSLPPAPVRLTTQDPISTVEQLQEGDLEEQAEKALLPTSPNDLSALIYEGTTREVDEQAIADGGTPSEERDLQP